MRRRDRMRYGEDAFTVQNLIGGTKVVLLEPSAAPLIVFSDRFRAVSAANLTFPPEPERRWPTD